MIIIAKNKRLYFQSSVIQIGSSRATSGMKGLWEKESATECLGSEMQGAAPLRRPDGWPSAVQVNYLTGPGCESSLWQLLPLPPSHGLSPASSWQQLFMSRSRLSEAGPRPVTCLPHPICTRRCSRDLSLACQKNPQLLPLLPSACVLIHAVLGRGSGWKGRYDSSLHRFYGADPAVTETESSSPHRDSILGTKQSTQSCVGILALPPHVPVASSVKTGTLCLWRLNEVEHGGSSCQEFCENPLPFPSPPLFPECIGLEHYLIQITTNIQVALCSELCSKHLGSIVSSNSPNFWRHPVFIPLL